MAVATPGRRRRSASPLKLRAVLVSLRPHQWTKNLVVFAALAFSKHLFEPGPLLRALLAFALFCGLSGRRLPAERRGRPRARPPASR